MERATRFVMIRGDHRSLKTKDIQRLIGEQKTRLQIAKLSCDLTGLDRRKFPTATDEP